MPTYKASHWQTGYNTEILEKNNQVKQSGHRKAAKQPQYTRSAAIVAFAAPGTAHSEWAQVPPPSPAGSASFILLLSHVNSWSLDPRIFCTIGFCIISLLLSHFKAKKGFHSALNALLGPTCVTHTAQHRDSLHPLCQFTKLGTKPSLINFYAKFSFAFSRSEVNSSGLILKILKQIQAAVIQVTSLTCVKLFALAPLINRSNFLSKS